MWDEEVDVVCVGGAVGVLSSALVAADAGAEVFVATGPLSDGFDTGGGPPPSRLERGWLTHASPDDEDTQDYFAALSEDLTALDPVAGDLDLPTRMVRELTRDEREGRWVEPFYGGRMRTWASQCLRSPYGLVHSRVADRQMTPMRTLDGRPIEVKPVGAVDTGRDPISLADWLADRAWERQIKVRSGIPLQRLVFEDGAVVGAVVETAGGPHAVRARHGVTIAPADEHATAAGDRTLRGYDDFVQLCLVSQSASRFARLELLNTASTIPQRAVTCDSTNRQLHQTMHDGGRRHRRSEAGRGRKLHRYPPAGQ